jgi:hypothetical protein
LIANELALVRSYLNGERANPVELQAAISRMVAVARQWGVT